ncbi:MAG: Ubiquinone biosynthesis O-methyltransferase [Pseudomonadota bacterium]
MRTVNDGIPQVESTNIPSSIDEILHNPSNWESCACPICSTEPSANDIAHEFPLSRYVKCSKCDLVFLSPRLREDAMRKVYENSAYFEGSATNLGYQSYSSQDDCYARTFNQRLLRALRYQSPGRSLDIGCGTGILVEEAAKLGYESHGIDVSAHGLSSRLTKLGDRFKQGTLEEVQYPDNYFDLVTLCDVIEHIYDPKAFARSLHRILAPGGIVALATPNYDALLRKILQERNVSFKIPEHVTYYPTKTLSLAMGPDFELLESRPTGQVCTLEFLRVRLSRLSPLLDIPFRIISKAVNLESVSFYIYSGSIFALFKKRVG